MPSGYTNVMELFLPRRVSANPTLNLISTTNASRYYYPIPLGPGKGLALQQRHIGEGTVGLPGYTGSHP